jgi:hypothetical protein
MTRQEHLAQADRLIADCTNHITLQREIIMTEYEQGIPTDDQLGRMFLELLDAQPVTAPIDCEVQVSVDAWPLLRPRFVLCALPVIEGP